MRRRPGWASAFPQLSALDDDAWAFLDGSVERLTFRAGEPVFSEREACRAYVLLLRGRIKVVKQWPNGRAITLYRIQAGCSCTASTALLITGTEYTADAVAEQDSELLLLPRLDFLSLFDRSQAFRRQVCREFGGRLSHLTGRLEAALFRPVDVRLADWLLEHRSDAGRVAITHQALAVELGSVREVVSRNLKQLEAKGHVRLGRGSITITDENALLAVAAPLSGLLSTSHAVAEPLAPPRTPLRRVQVSEWTRDIPLLWDTDDEAWRYVASRAQIVDVAAGTRPFSSGDPCGHYVIVRSGRVRVYSGLQNGREFTLYRLESGEACCASAAGVLQRQDHVANAVVEEDAVVVLIGDDDFHLAFHQSAGFRRFVVESYEDRIQDLLALLETLLVEPVEVRLARCLLRHGTANSVLTLSHEELAYEAGTAREVVSRCLKDWENSGSVRLGRRAIEILDVPALASLLNRGGSRSAQG